ncbi:hypothetical protein EMIT093MI4_80035 [Pseudomonas sp. IT-93MI4]
MGAGLLAKAVCQSTSVLNDWPPSRASPLPQRIFGIPATVYHSVQSQNTQDILPLESAQAGTPTGFTVQGVSP